nr:MAG TPA: hypothetical protein [Crassvirales sp.]
MVRTINVVYTTRKLSGSEASKLKAYIFLCSYDQIKVGDLIESPMYTTSMQVIGVSNYAAREQNGITLKDIIIDTINGAKVSNNQLNNNQKSNKMEKKSVFSSFIEKYKSQFIPEKEESLKLSMDGNICVPIGSEYVGINADNELISYPTEMCMDVPVYIISKPFNQVQVGDIVKLNNSFLKVLRKNDNGTLQCLSFSGYSSNRREIKDFMLGQALVRVVVNMFSGMTTNGFNPMMLALANNENMDMKDLMMMQMMQGNGAGFNPMMLMMMMMDKGGDSSMFETMMMMQMMGGQNPMMGFMNPATNTEKK